MPPTFISVKTVQMAIAGFLFLSCGLLWKPGPGMGSDDGSVGAGYHSVGANIRAEV